jgi:GAF domain-containing protein
MSEQSVADALAEARSTIARQAEELNRLRRGTENGDAGELRSILALAAAAGAIGSPVSHGRLLQMIVETAAAVIGARAGALFLIDEAASQLVFEVAIGPKAEEAKRFRVPLGHGIAGLVAVSGQPMAIADASQDPRQASDIAKGTGYIPQSILCVPLIYGERIIGVLELLDKEGVPTFGAQDMEMLGLFANQAAVAIEQSRARGHLGALIGDLLGDKEVGADSVRSRAESFADRLEGEDAEFREILELAELVNEIAWRGDEERRACRSLLQGFADYLRRRTDPLDRFGVGS